jgi:hypothetical protein
MARTDRATPGLLQVERSWRGIEKKAACVAASGPSLGRKRPRRAAIAGWRGRYRIPQLRRSRSAAQLNAGRRWASEGVTGPIRWFMALALKAGHFCNGGPISDIDPRDNEVRFTRNNGHRRPISHVRKVWPSVTNMTGRLAFSASGQSQSVVPSVSQAWADRGASAARRACPAAPSISATAPRPAGSSGAP